LSFTVCGTRLCLASNILLAQPNADKRLERAKQSLESEMATIIVTNESELQATLDAARPQELLTILASADFSGDTTAEVRVNSLVINWGQSFDSSQGALRVLKLTLGTNISDINLTGSSTDSGPVQVNGNNAANSITGGFGSDTLAGALGADQLIGSVANDTLFGGAGNDTILGGSGNDRLDLDVVEIDVFEVEQLRESDGADRLEGGEGDDRYGVDSYSDTVVENADGGRDTIFTDLAEYTLGAGSHVEDLIFRSKPNSEDPDAALPPYSTENVHGVGNELDNTIIAGDGRDHLEGLSGNDILVGNFAVSNNPDTLEGGLGDDQYEVDLLTDKVVERQGEGTDTIRITIGEGGEPDYTEYSLSQSDRVNVENLVLVGFFIQSSFVDPYGTFELIGNSLDNVIVGAHDHDIIRAGTGNDRLIGGTEDDTLYGGAGDDYYEVDSLADVVSEEGDEAIVPSQPGQVGGRDTIATSLKEYILVDGSHIENLTATRTIINPTESLFSEEVARTFTGNSLDNDLVGGDFNDVLTGMAGNDFLIGGRGSDHMAGGAGNDNYDVDDAGDVIVENANEGHDSLSTSRNSFDLNVSSGLSNVEDLIFSGTLIIKFEGDPAQGLPRIAEFNRNADFQGTGNALNNAIIGADGNDLILGLAGNDALVGLMGRDTLHGGDGQDELYGLGGNDSLIGGAGGDTLDGGADNDRASGEGGNDTLFGSTGNDWLSGQAGKDQIAGGEGRDRVSGGTGKDRLFGEAGADTLDGGTNNDRLYGHSGQDNLRGGSGTDWLYGGASSDTLRGDAGRDYFVFDAKPRSNNVDRIADFNIRDDTIRLEDFIFTKVGARGRLNADAFWTGNSAHDASDRIIYDSASGGLFYDPDGTGTAAQVKFANLSLFLNLTNKDFGIV
jgi:Ca2+-binding RTX toxin-like protein